MSTTWLESVICTTHWYKSMKWHLSKPSKLRGELKGPNVEPLLRGIIHINIPFHVLGENSFDGHWIVFFLNKETKCCVVYDSLKTQALEFIPPPAALLMIIEGFPFAFRSGWKFSRGSSVKQTGSVSCGLYMLQNIEKCLGTLTRSASSELPLSAIDLQITPSHLTLREV
ncbi:hypothetical protein OCU04_008324 [Sclerotinia nivalis]|uniref:Ubiquitin-like protease family profile domain-containing protein n=1 Tax=Sclerotinia nivalis TaxID=352851 RepID=A0A9X0AIX9_9HELO|nr:hypothetical protein OCU04_008324 [Sclerotinia nivalis]